MTLSELKFIIAVAHEKNFRKAAEKCFVSQPALSLAIKKLEDELSLTIFERSRTEVAVTPVGQLIVNQAIVILDEAAKIKELAKVGDNQLSQPFKLGLIYSVAPYLLPLVIPKLRQNAPTMPFEIEENITQNLEEKLKKGNIDAAIIALPFDVMGIDVINLYDEKFVAVIPVEHKWSDKKLIKTKELNDEKVLLLDNSHCFSNQVKEACPGLNKNSEVQLGNSLETIRNMVASNLGISVLPESACSLRYENNLVKILPFEEPAPFRRVALAFRKSSAKKNAISVIVESIKDLNIRGFNT